MALSDEELMLKVRDERDELAFELLVQRYKRSLLNFIYRFIGDRDTAEDLAQDVFLQVWKNANSYMPISKFSTFIFTIAKNICLNAIAKPKIMSDNSTEAAYNEDDVPSNQSSPEDDILSSEQEEIIKKAVAKLSPEHRMVFILTEYHGFSYQEVASILQCPVGTVASRKNMAIRLLRKYISSMMPDLNL